MSRGFAARFSLVGAILKSQGAVIRDLAKERNLKLYLSTLILATVLFSAAYGAILGMFQPGLQILYAAVKIAIVVLGTALLCTPTFYVFNSILGSKFTFGQTLATVLLMAASAALILVALAPIAWLFTVTTSGVAFITFLHLAVFLIAIGFGVHVLHIAQAYFDFIIPTDKPIHTGFLRAWLGVVLLVAFQLAYHLRPLLVLGPFYTGERGLFFQAIASLFGT